MICVGAHKNSFDRHEQNVIPRFSSHGPTYDNRVKPELVAPGEKITSALSDGDIFTRQCTVVKMWGTSMATAALAGSVALIRHHLRKVENVSSPSAALLKALLIHSTVNLNNSELSGFGRLDMSLFFTSTGIRGWFRDRTFIDHHASNMYRFTLGPMSPEVNELVRVSLVWTDSGAAMEGSVKSLVNDLDVVLVDSTGGLHFAGNNNTLDTTNVMEQISLSPSWELAAGFSVFVYGGSVHDGSDQPYALVVSGPSLRYVGDAESMPNVRCANNCSGHGDCVAGVCKCHSGYRFIDCSVCDEETVCHGHGTCEAKDMRCTCDNEHFADANCSSCKLGWYGPSCSSNCTCSNRGKCDVVTGECSCQQDKKWGGSGCFEGPNCEFCCKDFTGENCNLRSYWCKEDGWPVVVNDVADGYIQVNGYGSYPPMIVCRWVIEAPRGRRVRLEYLSFDVESPTDAVLVYNSAFEKAEPARSDTGTDAKGVVFFSTSNIVSIVFASQWSHVRRGFLLHYTFEKSTPHDCTLACVGDAFCDTWGGGFCVCDDGRAGWNCGVAVDARKGALELREGEKGGATHVTRLVNEEFQLALKHSSPRWGRADVYVAFDKDLFARHQSRVALRAAVVHSNPGGSLRTVTEEKIGVTSVCTYVRISIGRTLATQNGELNISFTLLYNASLSSVAGDYVNYLAAAYLAKSESNAAYKGDNDDAYSLKVYCISSLPSTVPSSVFGDLSPSARPGSKGSMRTFLGLALFVFVVYLFSTFCVAFTCRSLSSSEDIAWAEIPAEEVAVLASPDGGEEADDDVSRGSVEGLFSFLPPSSLEREAENARP
ncbi:hypothetical protein TRSC58_05432 [Trypanosoma rangeli SC58]|uniref:CUB domain-containing protein n=1 Tax=Trypanosoma rangeli SC58 TaxID=429131 RepID=A0A061IYC4_TRYRA|nr:hypothetical protein TRSC58_05432 [Trypanosoma rangeli SC58]